MGLNVLTDCLAFATHFVQTKLSGRMPRTSHNERFRVAGMSGSGKSVSAAGRQFGVSRQIWCVETDY